MIHELIEVENPEQFAFLAENREIIKNKKAFAKLKDSIRTRGILQPITVMPFEANNPNHLLKDGKPHLLRHPNDTREMDDVTAVKYLVLDGAHRFTIATEEGKTIPVVVNPFFSRMDIVSMNNLATKWGTEDYISCFARLGLQDYIDLKEAVSTWRLKEKFSVTDIAIHYSGDGSNSASDVIKTMSYKFDKSKGDTIMRACQTLKTVPSLNDLGIYNKRSVSVSVAQLIQKYQGMFNAASIASHINSKGITFTKEDNNKNIMYGKLQSVLFDMYDDGHNTGKTFTKDQKKIISLRDTVICRDSKCSIDEYDLLDVDHMNPYNGYNTIISNGQLLCGVSGEAHNQKKGDIPYELWKENQFN